MRELRQLKDLRHENVNTFIGLFIDPNQPALIFEYGHRGSLAVRNIFNINSFLNKILRIFLKKKKLNLIGILNGQCLMILFEYVFFQFNFFKKKNFSRVCVIYPILQYVVME